MPRCRYRFTSITILLLLGWLTPILSATGQNQSDVSNQSDANDVLPSLQSSADLELPDGRRITIHREAQATGARSKAVYFHRPIFALRKDPNWPRAEHVTENALIWHQLETENKHYVTLKLVLSSKSVVEHAKAAVLEEDPSLHVERTNTTISEIDVQPWPLKLMRLSARHSVTGVQFGNSIPKSLRAAGDEIEVNFAIPTDRFEEFTNALALDFLEFQPSYTFSNTIVAFGQSATRISGEVSLAVDNVLQSRQIEEGDPIFQSDVRDLKNELRQRIETTIRATDAQVLAHIKPYDISDKIFVPSKLSLDSLDGNQDLLAKVNNYLAPIIQEIKRENEDQNRTTNTTEDNSSNKMKVKLGKNGLGSDLDITHDQKRKLEKEHKLTFKETETSSVIEPHSITVNHVRSGWQSSLVDAFQTIYLAVGRDNSFHSDSPFRSDFTAAKLEEHIGKGRIAVAPHALVPRGVPLCSLRSNIPAGFVLMDGTSKFPDEHWVAAHLRGRSIPDLRGRYLRGSTENHMIGQIGGGAKIVVPDQTIDGGNYGLISSGVAGVFVDDSIKEFAAREKVGADGESGQNVMVGKFYRLSVKGTQVFTGQVAGSANVKGFEINTSDPNIQPQHVECQWIIRIR